MQADSYLELFTTMYGWAFANILGEILTGTGLAALPFGLIVFNAWREAKEQGMGHDGILSVLESVQTQLITAAFVMCMCFATTPFTSLSSIHLSFSPDVSEDGNAPQTVSLKSGTGSGYDAAMADAITGTFSKSGNLSHVPPWWFTAMAISSGVNSAFRAGMDNSERDLRMVAELARIATINDPSLLNELQRFYSECFIPARSKYLNMDRSRLTAEGQAILASDTYGPTDVDWVGSQLFRMEPTFYTDMRSYNPVPGWAIDFSRDVEYIQTPAPVGDPHYGYVNPDWGRPTCKQWWETDKTGVREKLINHSSSWRRLLYKAQSVVTFTSLDESKDSIARLAFEKANPSFVSPDKILGDGYGAGKNAWRTATGAASTWGVANQALDSALSIVPLLNTLPMLQALVLMALYMFLPLVTFVSGYDIKMMAYGFLAIFTVKFWTVMWFIARWMDAKLIDSMYPGLSGAALIQEVTFSFSDGQPQAYKRMILNTLLTTMFIGLPIIWTSMMAWAGYRINVGSGDLLKSGNSQSIGAGQATKSGVSKGMKILSKK